MPSRLHQMRRIVSALDERLRAAYPSGTQPSPDGGDPLVNAFTEFGIRAGEASMTMEDTMGASLEALQALFERSGGSGNDSATMRVAGVAAAATAKGYLSANAPEVEVQEPEPQPVPRQLARLAALHQINRAATANLKLAQMLDTVVDVVAQTTGSDACEVFLHDDSTGLLILRAAVGLNPASVNAVTIRIGMGITGLAAQESRIISAPDSHRHPAFLAHPGIGDEIYTSQVSLPILLQSPRRLVG
ncbi:MAG TPA: GAF domain-containing protein, partial [Thermomicrobiales bacterium]|nr:GAF domain-containing protein [Thermomicrobiales bacterium]